MTNALHLFLLSVLVGFGPPASQPARPRPILDLVPADSLVLYAAKPYSSLTPTTGPTEDRPANVSSIASIITFLNASGLISDEGQVFADIAAALPLLGKFEHAFVLMDVSSRLVDRPTTHSAEGEARSLRLNFIQCAVILRSRGEQRVVLEQINRIVSRYTNLEVATLSNQKWQNVAYQRLADQRLPSWAVWEWGRIGDFFVLTFGAGGFERVCKVQAGNEPSLAADEWYRRAAELTRSRQAIAQWLISFQGLRARLGDIAEARVAAVCDALHATDVVRDLWTIGSEGSSLSCLRCFHRDGADVVRRYSDPRNDPPAHRSIIPSEARRTAVIRVPTKWLVDNVPRGWLGAQSPNNAEKWRLVWSRLEQDTGLDIGGSLINHLGGHVVMFDYPPHPLNIPFAMTFALEIDDQRSVAMAVDALLGAWSRYLDERAERNKTTLVRLKVKRTEDGMWYLQAGILGPALKVTPRYIVISWSPEALRQALEKMPNAAKPVP